MCAWNMSWSDTVDFTGSSRSFSGSIKNQLKMVASQSLQTLSACDMLSYWVDACNDAKYIELASI